jgi:hypothetical protein
MRVGNLSVPASIIQDNEGSLISFMQDMIGKIPGLSINNAGFVNGQVKFDGYTAGGRVRIAHRIN